VLVAFDVELDVEPESDVDAVEPDDSDDDELPSEELAPVVAAVAAAFPRLSVLKKPEPLKVTPTGWNTFLTGIDSPVSGWMYSLSVSSVNACWTSMVSPVWTNL